MEDPYFAAVNGGLSNPIVGEILYACALFRNYELKFLLSAERNYKVSDAFEGVVGAAAPFSPYSGRRGQISEEVSTLLDWWCISSQLLHVSLMLPVYAALFHVNYALLSLFLLKLNLCLFASSNTSQMVEQKQVMVLGTELLAHYFFGASAAKVP